MPEPHDQLRAGIIGGGFMAGVHARSIRIARGTVAGVATRSAERAREAAGQLDAARAYDSPAELIDSPDIDVVHVCTPNASHAELVSLALAAGKHVVCEKPLATTVEDAIRLVSEAETAGLTATVPFVYRFHPLVRDLRDRLAVAGPGALFTVTGAYLQDWLSRPNDTNWRADSTLGGRSRTFADIGSHLVDLIEFVTGDRLISVQARTRTVYPQRAGAPVDTEDLGVVLFELAGGALGTLTVSQLAEGHKNALTVEVSAQGQSLRFEQENPEQLWVGRREGSQLLLRDPERLDGDALRLSAAPAGHPLGYLDAFAAFVADSYDGIRGVERAGLPTFHDGLRAAIVTEAIMDSASSGTAVAVPSA